MSSAPREGQIRLYLPGIGSKIAESGYPQHAEHAECIGEWDMKHLRWIEQKTRATVFPSQWLPLGE